MYLERSWKSLFIMVFDVFFIIVIIAALIHGPGGYLDYIESKRTADRGMAAVEFAGILRDELTIDGAVDPSLADNLELLNPYQLRGRPYGWSARIYRVNLGKQSLLIKNFGEVPGTNRSVQAYAVPVWEGNKRRAGILEVTLWC